MLIKNLALAFNKNKIPFAVVGGYAVALHGAVRGTVDVDIILQLKKSDFLKAEGVLNTMGLVSKLPISAKEVFEFRKEYIEKRNLLAWSFINPQNPIEILDIVLTQGLKKDQIKIISFEGVKIPILSKAALIKMKEKSGRDQDLEDIKALKNLKG